tara:strand:+ start:75 stop:470 length:396 start_codon:yes stop_codon:yes gene_type:complete
MPYIINHIHLKSETPKLTADWFVKAFNVEIISDRVRTFGDRFIETKDEAGMRIFISGARDGEELNSADDNPHYGLEHFGFDTDDIDSDIKRLVGMGAVHKEGPITVPSGMKIGYISAPGGIRIELIEPHLI